MFAHLCHLLVSYCNYLTYSFTCRSVCQFVSSLAVSLGSSVPSDPPSVTRFVGRHSLGLEEGGLSPLPPFQGGIQEKQKPRQLVWHGLCCILWLLCFAYSPSDPRPSSQRPLMDRRAVALYRIHRAAWVTMDAEDSIRLRGQPPTRGMPPKRSRGGCHHRTHHCLPADTVKVNVCISVYFFWWVVVVLEV